MPWKWCHDDAETSAFNVNIRLICKTYVKKKKQKKS